MKPVIIVPPKVMSDDDIKLLRDNELCVVVCENPSAVKFLDPIPAQSNRTEIEAAAIKLSRVMLNKMWGNYTPDAQLGQQMISRIFVDLLCEGTPLDRRGSREEQERCIIDDAREDELRKIGREEARAERAAKKAEKK